MESAVWEACVLGVEELMMGNWQLWLGRLDPRRGPRRPGRAAHVGSGEDLLTVTFLRHT